MSNFQIETLTSEQEAEIPVYQEKWRAIALSTKQIDKEKAAKAVKSLYTTQGMSTPKIVGVLTSLKQMANSP